MIDSLVLVISAVLAFIASTLAIRVGIPRLQSDSATQPTVLPESTGDIFDFRATGFWIGLCETFLIFVMVCAKEFSALAIIIGAKEFVRKEKIQANASYYLLGTLANLCIAVLFALIAQEILEFGETPEPPAG